MSEKSEVVVWGLDDPHLTLRENLWAGIGSIVDDGWPLVSDGPLSPERNPHGHVVRKVRITLEVLE